MRFSKETMGIRHLHCISTECRLPAVSASLRFQPLYSTGNSSVSPYGYRLSYAPMAKCNPMFTMQKLAPRKLVGSHCTASRLYRTGRQNAVTPFTAWRSNRKISLGLRKKTT